MAIKETRDHFVARTYLRRFTDENNKLLVYKKDSNKFISLKPETICCEKGWDLVNSALDIFWLKKRLEDVEPQLSTALTNLTKNNLFPEDRITISRYLSILHALNPVQLNITVMNEEKFITWMAKHIIDTNTVDVPKGYSKDFLKNNLKVDVNLDVTKMHICQHLQSFTQALFTSSWLVIKNCSATSFITSDNPFNFLFIPSNAYIYPKFGALDPNHLLFVSPPLQKYINAPIEFNSETAGDIIYVEADKEINIFNKYIVKGANRFVILGKKDEKLKLDVQNYISAPINSSEQENDMEAIIALFKKS